METQLCYKEFFNIKEKQGQNEGIISDNMRNIRSDAKKIRVREKGTQTKPPSSVFNIIHSESKNLLKVLPDLIFVLSKEGIFLDYHAPDLLALLLPPEQFIGRHFKEVLPKEVSDILQNHLKTLWQFNAPQIFEYPLMISGERLQFEARITIYDDGKSLIIVRDVTEQKRLEEKFKETYEKYRQLVENAPAGIYEIDFQNQKFVSVNDVMCEYTGYSREEFLSMHPLQILCKESHNIFFERMQRLFNNQSVSPSVELKFRTKTGSEIWTLLHLRFVYKNGKITGAKVIIHDITDRKNAELALVENEGHLKSLMENAEEFAIFRLVYDEKNPYGTEVVFVSPSITDICGITDRRHYSTWWRAIHPDDLEKMEKAQQDAFKTMRFDEVFRIYHAQKKQWRWINATSNGIPSQNGKDMYVNGILRDVTDIMVARENLEQRVQERTTQLIRTNEILKKEIRERKQIEKDLQGSKEKLRFLSNQLITAQEDERKRISNELHDELGQSLVGLKYQLSHLPKKWGEDSMEGTKDIKQSLQIIDGLAESIRRISRDLRPMVLEHLGLWEGLQWLFEEGVKNYGFKFINTIVPNDHWPLSKDQELIVFRIFQEAMTNIEKHAQAGQVFIEAIQENDSLIFTIKDDGRGFNPHGVKARGFAKRGLGLTSMAERARMAGGTLAVNSRKGKGTTITFSIPLAKTKRRTLSKKKGTSRKGKNQGSRLHEQE
jgi:PAS domain S-box-containing protein